MTPRQQKALERQLQRFRPMLTSGAGTGTVTGTNGTAHSVPRDDVFLAEVTAVTGTGTSATYSFTEQTAPPTSGGTEDRTSGRTADATKNAARYVGTGTLAVGDLVLARRHLANVNEYEILCPAGDDAGGGGADNGPDAGGGPILIGKLDGALSYQGSATMSIWSWNGSAYADSNDNVTVYDWVLSSGQTVAAGVQVIASYDARSDRYFLISAQCEA